jgi:hypothetical protein
MASEPDKLREQLRRMHERNTLPDHQRAQLRKLLQQGRPRLRRMQAVAAAALCVLVLAGGLLWQMLGHIPANPSVDLMAEEVSTNHLRIKSLDVLTEAVQELQQKMGELDFAPQWPSHLDKAEFTLVGGRYCTLRGAIAAQLFLKNAKGERVTLYQTGYRPEQFGKLPQIRMGERPIQRQLRGVRVSLWVEAGLVMALATSDDTVASQPGLLTRQSNRSS